MGFIENEMVDVSAKRFHIGQYYENLGYEIPKIQYKGYIAKRAGREMNIL